MSRMVNVDRETLLLMPPSLQEWVSHDDLVHFILDAVEQSDTTRARINHRGTGSEQYPPSMMLGLLIYCYAIGVFSSRRIEQAELADLGTGEDGGKLPPELSSREKRLARLQAAKRALEEREKQKASQKSKPDKQDRGVSVNTTDPESRPMPTRQEGYKQGYNAQAAVTNQGPTCLVAAQLTNATNDREQLIPVLASIPSELGTPQEVLVDAGDDNGPAIEQIENKGEITVYCPVGNMPKAANRYGAKHPRTQLRKLREDRMKRMESPEWQKTFSQRATTIERVFSVIKNSMGFKAFRLRGLIKAQTEWLLVCLAYNRRTWAAI